MTEQKPTTGIREIDRILGGVVQSDNIVWEWDSGAPIDRFMAGFLAACERERSPVVYVSFNRSSQTVAANHRGMISKGLFTLVDCFSYGKGNADRMFLHSLPEFPEGGGALGLVHVERPSDPVELQNVLISIGARSGGAAKYVFDSLTGMLDVWGDEERVIRFFGYFCPRLHDLNTIACWLLEKGAHSPSFLAKVRHITQVVLEIGVSQGVGTLTVRKAADRVCGDIGIPHPFRVEDGRLDIRVESREGRELALLTSMSEALDRGLDPAAFFEKTMDALASEIGMVRGTLALLDKTTGRLRTVAALGHAAAGAELGGVAEEEIVGQVLHTGIPEVVPDISRDPRFRHRGLDGEDEPSPPTAFLGVPLRVDGQAVGVLCVERSFAAEAALEKDLRLLSIVAATVSQAIKINRMIRMEKEEIAVRHREHVRDLRRQYRIDHVVGESEAIKQVLATAGLAAKSQASILITGETGTGKELVAHVVHYNSSRAKGPFVKVNCGALSETLLESG
ncbi:MAG: sigma 54-interacting transcriptional regulator, partial [Kiritimatiellae bacterium]|nr:sigma 54-interacting transcriptional regulator [Kiritimatiellia bacterium]